MDFMTILIFVAFGGMAALGIALVVVIMKYVQPLKNSPAKFFVKAKKEKKKVFIMDDGARFIIATGKTIDDNMAVDDNGNAILISPDSIKYCMGVEMAIGENYRSIVTNAVVADIINFARKHNWDAKKIMDYIKRIEQIQQKTESEIKSHVEEAINVQEKETGE